MLEKLRSEILSITEGEEDITRSHIQRMPYLRNVVNESKDF